MLYTYAIEPDALATWDKCRRLFDLMGFQHGRAIAAYPTTRRWQTLVREACNANTELGDRDHRRIMRKLAQSKAKLVGLDGAGDYDDTISPVRERWIRNAVARQTAVRTFHAILATRNPDGHPDVVLEDDVDGSHDKLAVSREVPVLREPAALAAHVRTLVRNSRELLLIDPHFDPSVSKWRPVVEACIELASQTAYENPKVVIHTLDADRKPSLNEFRRRCQRYIPNMMYAKVTSIRVCRWRIRDGDSLDFHGRYLLTNRGGYRLDKGLDAEHGVEQPVGLLDEREWKRLREGYSDANPFFEKADAFTLDKFGTQPFQGARH